MVLQQPGSKDDFPSNMEATGNSDVQNDHQEGSFDTTAGQADDDSGPRDYENTPETRIQRIPDEQRKIRDSQKVRSEEEAVVKKGNVKVRSSVDVKHDGPLCGEAREEDKKTEEEMASESLPADTNLESMPWSEDSHKDFVAAVFEIGMAHATPSIIAERMQLQSPEVTSERLKSHLQKFRKRKHKEKEAFLEEYSRGIEKLSSGHDGSVQRGTGTISSVSTSIQTGASSIMGGEAVALLTCSVRKEEEENVLSANNIAKRAKSEYDIKSSVSYGRDAAGHTAACVPFPVLTEREKSSGLGRSLIFIRTLAEYMSKQLAELRGAGQAGTNAASSDNPAFVNGTEMKGIDGKLPSVIFRTALGLPVLSAIGEEQPDVENMLLTAADLESTGSTSGSSSFQSSADFIGRNYFPIQDDRFE